MHRGHHVQDVQTLAQVEHVLPLRQPVARTARHAARHDAIGGTRHPKEANEKAGRHAYTGKQRAEIMGRYLDHRPDIEERLLDSIGAPADESPCPTQKYI